MKTKHFLYHSSTGANVKSAVEGPTLLRQMLETKALIFMLQSNLTVVKNETVHPMALETIAFHSVFFCRQRADIVKYSSALSAKDTIGVFTPEVEQFVGKTTKQMNNCKQTIAGIKLYIHIRIGLIFTISFLHSTKSKN